jgi:DNA mismatch repair protein MutS2
MDNHTYRVLEFNKILEMASVFAATGPGREVINAMRPLPDIEDISSQIALISECRQVLSEGRHLGIEQFDNLLTLLKKLRPADSILEPVEFRSFLPLFYSAFNLKIFSHSIDFPGLGDIASGLTTHAEIKDAIEKSIDREGKITDNASPELSRIRQKLKTCETKIKTLLDGILKQKDLEPHLQDYYLAERNNRWVIPVKTDSKGSVPGVVHDISNTGETVYIEPYSIQVIGNELESLRAEEKLEMYRILQRLAALLREHIDTIKNDYHIIARVDAMNALAGFAEKLDMSPPEINNQAYIKIVAGRHPLLWKTLNKEKRDNTLVPLDMEIGRHHSCMIITGSNAGGKTVALKTIGILTMMALSGMHIPAGSGTSIPFLSRVFADIGDDQSIEQNLSTFSAHVTRISEILRNSDSRSLVIFDELGTGTDPEQGGALSCSILRKLKERGILTIVSTHLGMLKAFAHSEEGMINSSMEMREITDTGITSYRPTYRLSVGEPGTSHALEIAESLGLQKEVIKEARNFLKGEGAEIESLIADLKKKNMEIDIRLEETEKLRYEVTELRSSLDKELMKIKSDKQDSMAKALAEAEEIIRKTKLEAAEMIDKVKKAGMKEKRKIMKELDKKQAGLKKQKEAFAPEKLLAIREAKEGQHVFINSLRTHGVVLSVNDKTGRCKVMANGKEIMIPLTGLSEASDNKSERISNGPGRGERPLAPALIDNNISNEINVIGERVDPALSRIERYLNDASLAGLKQVKIIHGIGSGILAAAIREFLMDHPLVEESRTGHEEEGSHGVTIVSL